MKIIISEQVLVHKFYYLLEKKEEKDLVLSSSKIKKKKKIDDHSKAKEHYKLFLKNKLKKFPKHPKLWKNSKQRWHKIYVKAYKTIKHNYARTRKKFDMESVTIDHPKIAFKLSKPTTIAQKLNKIKIYIKSITTDRTLQLDIFKRHIIPKKCSQFYKIKILNSK